MYVQVPLSLRYLEALRAERGIAMCGETVRPSWNRFGPRFAADMRRADSLNFAEVTHLLQLTQFELADTHLAPVGEIPRWYRPIGGVLHVD